MTKLYLFWLLHNNTNLWFIALTQDILMSVKQMKYTKYRRLGV